MLHCGQKIIVICGVLVGSFLITEGRAQTNKIAFCSNKDISDHVAIAQCMLSLRDKSTKWTWIEHSRPLSCKAFLDDYAEMVSVSEVRDFFATKIRSEKSEVIFPSCNVLAKSWNHVSQKKLSWVDCVDDGSVGSERHIAKCISREQNFSHSSVKGASCGEIDKLYKNGLMEAGAFKGDKDNYYHETSIYSRIVGQEWQPTFIVSPEETRRKQILSEHEKIGQQMRVLQAQANSRGADRNSLSTQFRELQNKRNMLVREMNNIRSPSLDPVKEQEQARMGFAKWLPPLFGSNALPNVSCGTYASALKLASGVQPAWANCSNLSSMDVLQVARACIPERAILQIRTCDEARSQLRSIMNDVGEDQASNRVLSASCAELEPIVAEAEQRRRLEAQKSAMLRAQEVRKQEEERKRRAEEASRPDLACVPYHDDLVSLDKEVTRHYVAAFGESKINEAMGPVVALQMLFVCPIMNAKYPMFFYDLCIDQMSKQKPISEPDGNNRPGWIGSSPVPIETKKKMQSIFARAVAGGFSPDNESVMLRKGNNLLYELLALENFIFFGKHGVVIF